MTTLATVGFGDLHPVTKEEALVCSFILLFGVAVFSFIMGNFIEMLMSFKHVTAENQESENLTKWMGLLARFNKGRPLPKDLTKKIENYFDHYWSNDRNYAVKSADDRRFLQELPKRIRIEVNTNIHEINCRYTRTSCLRATCTCSSSTSRCRRTRMRSAGCWASDRPRYSTMIGAMLCSLPS